MPQPERHPVAATVRASASGEDQRDRISCARGFRRISTLTTSLRPRLFSASTLTTYLGATHAAARAQHQDPSTVVLGNRSFQFRPRISSRDFPAGVRRSAGHHQLSSRIEQQHPPPPSEQQLLHVAARSRHLPRATANCWPKQLNWLDVGKIRGFVRSGAGRASNSPVRIKIDIAADALQRPGVSEAKTKPETPAIATQRRKPQPDCERRLQCMAQQYERITTDLNTGCFCPYAEGSCE